MSEKELLVMKRASCRGRVTNIINEAGKQLAETASNADDLLCLLKRLELANTDLNEISAQIENTMAAEITSAEINKTYEYADRATVCMTKLQSAISTKGSAFVSPLAATNSASNSYVPSPSPINFRGNLKIDLVPFSGKPRDWLAFWENFSALVDSDPNCPVVTKFALLRQSLRGNALFSLSGLPPTAQNYPIAVELLKKRFGDSQVLIQEHVNNLTSVPTCSCIDDINTLRRIHSIATTNYRALQSLNMTTETLGSILYVTLSKCLPRDILFRFHRNVDRETDQCANPPATLPTSSSKFSNFGIALLDFLGDDLECLERSRRESPSNSNTFVRLKQTRNDNKHKGGSAASLHLLSGKKGPCVLCKSSAHSTEHCDSSLSIEEKKSILKGRCFKCTWHGHVSRDCRRKVECIKCKGRHATSMCDPTAATRRQSNNNEPPHASTSVTHVGSRTTNSIYLQTASIWAKGEDPSPLCITALIDGGSERTFITEAAANSLRCKIVGNEQLTLHTFGTSSPQRTFNRVKVQLWSRRGPADRRYHIEALVVPTISNRALPSAPPLAHLPPAFQNLPLADYSLELQDIRTTSLLIGADYMWQLTCEKVLRDPASSLVAIETVFGWTLQGSMSSYPLESASSHVRVNKILVDDHDVGKTLSQFWDMESLGITFNESPIEPAFDPVAFSNSQIIKTAGRYQTSLPWKTNSTSIDNNYYNARSRLFSLSRRLSCEPETTEMYHRLISEYERDGIIELMSDQSAGAAEYYMPHRHVVREESWTTRVRIVFDASASKPGFASLNECLHAGPNWNPSLVSVLLNFRRFPIIIKSDVARAFLQISITPEDRNFLKFLWFKSLPQPNKPLPPIVTFRFCRLPFGVTCGPFILSAVIRRHLETWREKFPDTVTVLERSIYVDDLLISVQSVSEAKRIYEEATIIFTDAGMSLRKWTSNEPVVTELFASNEAGRVPVMLPSSGVLKVLGMAWDRERDNLVLNLHSAIDFADKQTDTKRFLLQTASRIFDPLGFLSPFVVRIKLLFQEVWKAHLNWDDKLPPAIFSTWNQWRTEIKSLTALTIPRCYHNLSPNLRFELHLFSDASPSAYGCVAYLRTVSDNGDVSVALLMAKSRVSPLKQKLTIPRLELTGCVLSARLAQTISTDLQLPLSATNYWTDSQIALAWIIGPASNWKPFVKNRIEEIRQLTSSEQWNFVSGRDNPADCLTRGISAQQLQLCDLWWRGPAWLSLRAVFFPPSTAISNTSLDQVESERNASAVTLSNVAFTSSTSISPFITREDFSTLDRLLRVTAVWQRFLHNRYTVLKKQHDLRFGPITSEEMHRAELYWIRHVQQSAYSSVYNTLKRGLELKGSDPLAVFQPYLDQESLIRIRGRLDHLDASNDVRHPILLPKDDHYSTLLVLSTHRLLLHSGTNSVMTHIRERFWIIGMRSLVRKLLHRCVTCQRFHARPLAPPTAPLPTKRITEGKPFETTGVDFAGPLYAKNGSKCYVCLFTCATTRMLHLELVPSLETSTFLLALRRFMARRGMCATIISDNARTFQRAEKDIRALYRKARGDSDIGKYLSSHNIQWQFNVPLAPWWGGFYERLVQSVKLSLKKVIGHKVLSFDELQTLLCDVEATINSRPLTYIDDATEGPRPLTPAELCLGHRLSSLPDVIFPINDEDTGQRKTCIRRYNFRQRLLGHFWRRWRTEYLLRLSSAHKVAASGTPVPIKEGDIVIVHDHTVPRQYWKLARVSETFPGRDGHIRSVNIKCGSQIFKRPVQLLSRLEIGDELTQSP